MRSQFGIVDNWDSVHRLVGQQTTGLTTARIERMSAAVEWVEPGARLARIQAELRALQEADLSGLSDEQVLDYGRELERTRRLLPSADARFITEVEARELPASVCARGTGGFLRMLLRIDPHEAHARVEAAHATGPRRALTGEPLPPVFEQVAAAQAAGAISDRHARIIVTTIDKLPDEITAENGEQIEAELVDYASRFDPHHLAKLARHIGYCYDPDGKFNDVDHRAKHRELTITQRPDGSSTIKCEATAELTELLLLHMDAFAKPLPAIDGFKDPRTASQRRHDALLEALKLNVRAQQLPSVAGVTATVILTMSVEDFEQRKGLARTAHGALIPVPEAMRITAGEYRLMNVVIDKTKGIAAYSSTARLFPEGARLAMIAHDGGCTFPNCNAPPGRCEIDHVLDWAKVGITRVDVGVPACHPHNVLAKQQGWRSTRIDGRAAWIPPKWIDPEQRPRSNHLHDTEPT